ncbi:hypothetical protein [Pseudonocardia sp. H11422]|uniref:hypothetical protein n=1 Tax=Pseudonocardia sp. H11422 TaxID=2835866 RepID=UPI001BDD9321|nr:hypothetical protein [Pseudonocardia sp. H11422]
MARGRRVGRSAGAGCGICTGTCPPMSADELAAVIDELSADPGVTGHSRTRDVAAVCRRADVVVAAR